MRINGRYLCEYCHQYMDDGDGNVTAYTMDVGWDFCSEKCQKEWYKDAKHVSEYIERYTNGVHFHFIPQSCIPECEVCYQRMTLCGMGENAEWICLFCQQKERDEPTTTPAVQEPIKEDTTNDKYQDFHNRIMQLHNTGDMDRVFEFISDWRSQNEWPTTKQEVKPPIRSKFIRRMGDE